uniref:Uncharacterized protein n=1 Tax=Plectus sambesii TaxID=2011161 RepID=A0A914W7F4_9BILA
MTASTNGTSSDVVGWGGQELILVAADVHRGASNDPLMAAAVGATNDSDAIHSNLKEERSESRCQRLSSQFMRYSPANLLQSNGARTKDDGRLNGAACGVVSAVAAVVWRGLSV